MEGLGSWVTGEPPYDIVEGGLLNAAHCGKLVHRNTPLFAERPYSLNVDPGIVHGNHLGERKLPKNGSPIS